MGLLRLEYQLQPAGLQHRRLSLSDRPVDGQLTNQTGRSLTILLIVVSLVQAFLAGTVTATVGAPEAVEALAPGQWAAVQASNALLLDRGPVSVYLPVVLRTR